MALWGEKLSAVTPANRIFHGLQKCLDMAREQKMLALPKATAEFFWRNVVLLQRKQFLVDVFRADAPEYQIERLQAAVQSFMMSHFVKRPAIEPWFHPEYIKKL